MSEPSINPGNQSLRRRHSVFVELSLLVGGMMAAVFAAGWMRRKKSHSMGGLSRAARTRQMLGQAIVGKSREAILEMFGPPLSSAGFESIPVQADTKNTFLRAKTWYYVLDNVQRRAMVIEFENGIARRAQFIRGPGVVRGETQQSFH